MDLTEKTKQSNRLNRRLATGGFRFTPQRERVYAVLLGQRDHPTAEEVFIRVKREMPDISMATVYNCLEALVQCGLVRRVSLARGAARFCPNMREHGHFYCDACERIFDIDLPPQSGVPLPKGFAVSRVDIAIRGRCPACASGKEAGRQCGSNLAREQSERRRAPGGGPFRSTPAATPQRRNAFRD